MYRCYALSIYVLVADPFSRIVFAVTHTHDQGHQSASSAPSSKVGPGRPGGGSQSVQAMPRTGRRDCRHALSPMLSQCPYAHHATVLTRLALREQGERNQENSTGHPAGAAAEEIETGQEDRQP